MEEAFDVDGKVGSSTYLILYNLWNEIIQETQIENLFCFCEAEGGFGQSAKSVMGGKPYQGERFAIRWYQIRGRIIRSTSPIL
jgi:hypothetical protein